MNDAILEVTFDVAMNELLDRIKADYFEDFVKRDVTGTRTRMYKEFCEGITIEEGRKYIKVLTNRSVWGFIMKADDKKFKAGDILKAAGYNAPARNAARGNIFDENYVVRWTGPLYLV